MPKHESLKLVIGNLSVLVLATLLGCAQTSAPPNPVQQPAVQSPAPSPTPTAMQPPSYPSASNAVTSGEFEQPPVVNISEFLLVSMQSGNGYYLGQQVPTNGAMGQYTIIANADVFGKDAGTYRVESLDLLKIRLSEIPAIAQLENISETGVFAKALASSAERPVADAANMVMHPMDSVTGLPNGVGELFSRVSLGAGQIASSASHSFGSGQAAREAGNATLTALGYDQVRRDLARKLHVDPYTSDPILSRS